MAMHSCGYVLLVCLAMVPVTASAMNLKEKHNTSRGYSENKAGHGYSPKLLYVGLTVVEDAVAKGAADRSHLLPAATVWGISILPKLPSPSGLNGWGKHVTWGN